MTNYSQIIRAQFYIMLRNTWLLFPGSHKIKMQIVACCAFSNDVYRSNHLQRKSHVESDPSMSTNRCMLYQLASDSQAGHFNNCY